MKNTKVLEMLNSGEIELLKTLLMDEIYKDSLKLSGNAKQRYMAMKRFFKYTTNDKKSLLMPCENVKVHGNVYNSFIDGYCLALTTESIGEIESYKEDNYFNVEQLINFTAANSEEKVDLNNVLAAAKSQGYKYKKNELGVNFQCAFKYKDAYFKMGLLDKAYSIINDGEVPTLYYINNKSILLITSSLGIAGVLPFMPKENVEETHIIIEHQ